MFRKMHSNRDPRDTLFKEIKKEFAPHFEKSGKWLRSFSSLHPKFIFTAMVIAMLSSLIIALMLPRLRREDRPSVALQRQKMTPMKITQPLNSGLDQILDLAAEIKERMMLEKIADSLILKKSLTKQDSITLETALDRIQEIKKKRIP